MLVNLKILVHSAFTPVYFENEVGVPLFYFGTLFPRKQTGIRIFHFATYILSEWTFQYYKLTYLKPVPETRSWRIHFSSAKYSAMSKLTFHHYSVDIQIPLS